jgi:hypothetical protein
MDDRDCNHTKDIVPWPARTWVDRIIGKRTAVVCSVCGRFYGYRRDERQRKSEGAEADPDVAER